MLCRLADVLRQEAAAKTAAVRRGLLLRMRVEALQERLDEYVIGERAAEDELVAYKQQVSHDNMWFCCIDL